MHRQNGWRLRINRFNLADSEPGQACSYLRARTSGVVVSRWKFYWFGEMEARLPRHGHALQGATVDTSERHTLT